MDGENIILTFLGTGTSHGVPMIGCSCPTCKSEDPRDVRTNASIMLSASGKNILIDCGRDFRQQALREGIDSVDYLLITHTHFDHVAGIDDLRVFSLKDGRSIPLFGAQEHLEHLRRYIYHYLFDRTAQVGGGIAKLDLIAVDGQFVLQGILFEPLPVYHGELPILGYKFLDCAYISDVSHIPDSTLRELYNLDVLILDALRYRSHSTHFNVEQALEVIAELKPSEAYLTHICHDIKHAELESRLMNPSGKFYAPSSVRVAYDGLKLLI